MAGPFESRGRGGYIPRVRHDGRQPLELRKISIIPDFQKKALGSVLIECGGTRVICSASVEAKTPGWVEQGGWLTAEYAMLPGSTQPRKFRKSGGREKEIQRLIGRSLRAAVDLAKLHRPDGNGISIMVDCDVLEADGGTRTAAVTGGFAALAIALSRLQARGDLEHSPVVGEVAAVSVGLLKAGAEAVVDLDYVEDSSAVVDMNVVMRRGAAGSLDFVEVQGTGEGGVFGHAALQQLVQGAEHGIKELLEYQKQAIVSAVKGDKGS